MRRANPANEAAMELELLLTFRGRTYGKKVAADGLIE
jgi:hypothetical protein